MREKRRFERIEEKTALRKTERKTQKEV